MTAILGDLQHPLAPLRPQNGGQDDLRGLQGEDPDHAFCPEPKEADQKGGEAIWVDPDFGEAMYQVISVLVQLGTGLTDSHDDQLFSSWSRYYLWLAASHLSHG